MSASGVYEIHCEASGKRYIGSSKDWLKRVRSHVDYLVDGNHHNDHLQHAWDRYGPEPWGWNLLFECKEDLLLDVEQAYFDRFIERDEWGLLYNIAKKAHSPGSVGEENGNSILTWNNVKEIRRRYRSTDDSTYTIASDYPVSNECIRLIVKEKRWKP